MLCLLFFLSSLAATRLVVPLSPNCSARGTCVKDFTDAVSKCRDATFCTIQLSAGKYLLSGPVYTQGLVRLAGVHNIHIVGVGKSTELIAADIATTFVIQGSSNITFTGFSLDNVRLPFTLAQVTSTNGTSSTLSFDSSMYSVDLGRYPWLESAQAAISFDLKNDRYGTKIDNYWTSSPKHIHYISKGVMVIGANFPVGEALVVRHQVYSYNAFSFIDSDDVAAREVWLYSTPGMGFLFDNCSGIVVDGAHVEKKPNRPMSITADGLHASNTRGGLVSITRSTFEGQGDDGINIPTIYQDVEQISSDRLTLTLGKNGQVGVNHGIFSRAGQTVNFFDRHSMQLLGQRTVAAVSWSAGTVTLTHPAPAAAGVWTLVNNAGLYAQSVVVAGCVFRANRARGALLKSSHVLFANNTVQYTTGPAVITETDGCFWFEGHPVTNWTVRGNSFTNCNYGTARQPADIFVNSVVSVFKDGRPSGQCQAFAGPPINFNVSVADNTFRLSQGQAAFSGLAIAGVGVVNNSVTRSVPRGSYDFDCSDCQVDPGSVSGNSCGDAACSSHGF